MTSISAASATTVGREAEAPAPLVRIAPGADGVSIWSDALFVGGSTGRLREFLSRVFSVDEVLGVELRRDEAFGRITYRTSADPQETWRKLSRAIREPAKTKSHQHAAGSSDADALFLDGPSDLPVEISRLGPLLSSWRVRYRGARRLRLSHPILRRRRDVAFRLEEALGGVLGVQSCRTSTISGTVAIRIDPHRLSADALVRRFEDFWPLLLEGLDGPPSNARLYAAGGLLGLTATGQFLVPALRPIGLIGVAIYGFTNVTTAVRQLLRGQVGLPAMYTFGLGLMLLSGMPFNSTVFAVLMQSWPRLARGTFQKEQRRLFAVHRQQPIWARLHRRDGTEIEVALSTVKAGDIVSVRDGDIVPVDGLVVEGLAAVDEESLTGVAGATDKAVGDAVFATGYVRGGHILVKAAADGGSTIASEIARLLPHEDLTNLPSSQEAERVANRNAKPALALAIASVVSRQLVRPAQAIIRPDYITANRLGAQLAILRGLGAALHQGVVFRRPRALDLLAATDIYVIDDVDALHRRAIDVAAVFVAGDVASIEVVRAAAAAFPALQNERVRALQDRGRKVGGALPPIFRRRRAAGIVHYEDEVGRQVEIASAAVYKLADLPKKLTAAIQKTAHAQSFDPRSWPDDPLLRPLIVRRNGDVIGAIAFQRSGAFEAAETIRHLRAINSRARFVHLSSTSQRQADEIARHLGLDTALGDLDAAEKAQVIRELGPRVLWIGDGSQPESSLAIGAATVSISVAGFRALPDDQADISLLHESLTNLLPLRRVAGQHRAVLDRDYRTVYAVNLLGVAGGILGNFGGLQAGLLSNTGTALVYLRHRRHLLKLAAALEQRRSLLTTSGREEAGRLLEAIETRASDIERPVRSPTSVAPNQPTERGEGV